MPGVVTRGHFFRNDGQIEKPGERQVVGACFDGTIARDVVFFEKIIAAPRPDSTEVGVVATADSFVAFAVISPEWAGLLPQFYFQLMAKSSSQLLN